MLSRSLLRRLGALWQCRRLVVKRRSVVERGGGGRGVVKALWVVVFVATSRCSILEVCLPSDVTTAVCVVTSEEASAQSGATLSRSVSPSHCLALRWFWSRVGRVGVSDWRVGGVDGALLVACGGGLVVLAVMEFLTLFLSGRACGETFLLTWLLGVSRGDTWLFLPDLVEVWDVGYLCRVVFGPTLVVGRGITLFHCFFLLLWLVASFPTGFGVSCRRVLLLFLGARAASVVAVFARVAVGFVLGLRIRVVVSQRLREPTCGVAFTVGIFARAKQMLVCRVALLVECCDTCLWLLSALCWLVVNFGEVLSEFFSVGSGGRLRYAVVVLAQNGALVVLVEFCLLRSGLCSFWATVVLPLWFEECRLVELRSVGWFASFLVPYVLYQMVVCVVSVRLAVPPVGVLALRRGFLFRVRRRPVVCLLPLLSVGCSGWWCFHMAFGAVSRTVAKVVVTYCPVSYCASFLLPDWEMWGSVPYLCLEALVTVWCVALSTCVGSGPVWPVLPFLACGFLRVDFGRSLVESPSLLVLKWFVFMSSGALVRCVALWVAPGACVSTVC
ncbi:hypothetical protein Taro_014250 [Colocasia esculenta]|uniref:Uncharacterized protein n=1 Tax=Colocasia esculenta TaxID=4460 RepID=A0A843UPM9_COLES|nr:hypothetical protein [Colocasia esculenta]